MGCVPDRNHKKNTQQEDLNRGSYTPIPSETRYSAPPGISNRGVLGHDYIPQDSSTATRSPRASAPFMTPVKPKSRSPRKRTPSSGKVDDEKMQRKRGEIIELPVRRHVITKVEAPSETVGTTEINKLEKHPSLFFENIEEKDVLKVFKERSSVPLTRGPFSREDKRYSAARQLKK